MIIPEIKISYKIIRPSNYQPIIAKDFYTLSNVIKPLFDNDTFDWVEEMILLCLNRRNEVICFSKLSIGGITGTVCDVRKILLIAIQSQATSIVLAHNHPSGNMKPSESDKVITEQLVNAIKYHDIKLLDHFIFVQDGFYSMKDEGDIY